MKAWQRWTLRYREGSVCVQWFITSPLPSLLSFLVSHVNITSISFKDIKCDCLTMMLCLKGIVLVTTIKPGVSQSADNIERAGSTPNVSTVDTLLDLVR